MGLNVGRFVIIFASRCCCVICRLTVEVVREVYDVVVYVVYKCFC